MSEAGAEGKALAKSGGALGWGELLDGGSSFMIAARNKTTLFIWPFEFRWPTLQNVPDRKVNSSSPHLCPPWPFTLPSLHRARRKLTLAACPDARVCVQRMRDKRFSGRDMGQRDSEGDSLRKHENLWRRNGFLFRQRWEFFSQVLFPWTWKRRTVGPCFISGWVPTA